MARFSLHIKAQASPDVRELVDYLCDAIDRFVATDMRGCNPQVIALARLYERNMALGGDALFTADYTHGRIVVEPSDLLLDMVARFRGVENALRPRRPEV